MKYRIQDVPAILRTPLGGEVIRSSLMYRAWPITSLWARVYRRVWVGRTRLVAVTGSFGKSTTARAVLTGLGIAIPDNVTANHKGGIVQGILRIRRSQALAVMEVGIDRPGQMDGFARVVQPQIGVVTAVGSEHGGSLGTLDATRDEKAKLVQALPPDGLAVLNGDDARVLSMRETTRAQVTTFGFGPDCQIRAEEPTVEPLAGSRLRVSVRGRSIELRTKLLGRHMAYPILAALAVAEFEGVDLDQTAARLSKLEPTPGRMELIRAPNEVTVVGDYYKSSYETFEAALRTMAEFPARRKILVLGDVSEPPAKQGVIYRSLASLFVGYASLVFCVGHQYQRYRAGAVRAGLDAEQVVDAGSDPLEAAERVGAVLEPGDVVLIKGRDTQRLDRIALALEGKRVGCAIRFCDVRGTRCRSCPMLEAGWDGHTEFMTSTPRLPTARRRSN